MGLLSPYNVEGKWSSAGAGDQGHTRDGNLATEQLLRLGQSSTGIRLDADHEWFAHRWSALTRKEGMVASSHTCTSKATDTRTTTGTFY